MNLYHIQQDQVSWAIQWKISKNIGLVGFQCEDKDAL